MTPNNPAKFFDILFFHFLFIYHIILVAAASFLYHSLKNLQKDRVTVVELVYSSPGLNLDPNTSNCAYDYLSSPSLESCHIVLWHDLLNNTITSHPKKNLPQTVEQLVPTIKTLRNIDCVVTCQRDGAPTILNTHLESLNFYVVDVTTHIISAFEKLEEATLSEYKKLHQSLDLELRLLGVVQRSYQHQAKFQKSNKKTNNWG